MVECIGLLISLCQVLAVPTRAKEELAGGRNDGCVVVNGSVNCASLDVWGDNDSRNSYAEACEGKRGNIRARILRGLTVRIDRERWWHMIEQATMLRIHDY